MNNQKVVRHKEISTFVLVICVITALCISIPVLLQIKATDLYLNGSINTQVFSNIGGFLAGSVGIIFTFGGLFFLYLTLKAQREMFIEQQEFVLKQQEVLEQQRFETTFFNMLTILNQIINSIQWNEGQTQIFGKACFSKFYQTLLNVLNSKRFFDNEKKMEINTLEFEEYKNYMINIYENFYNGRKGELGHYFRFIYHIIKLIVRSNLDEEKKKQYMGVLQAYLSNYELSLIFYNAISKHGGKNFADYLNEYGFLENIDKKVLLHPEKDFMFYPKTKFKYLGDDDKQ